MSDCHYSDEIVNYLLNALHMLKKSENEFFKSILT